MNNKGLMVCLLWAGFLNIARPAEWPAPAGNTNLSAAVSLEVPRQSIWETGIGEGFRSNAKSFAVEVGTGPGFAVFGSDQAHDLAIASLAYSHMLGPVQGQGRWYRGNFEGRIEFFGGAEYRPDTEWLFGLTPHLRYNFATGTRLVPFIDGGAGVTATGIGPPDLSNTFEFNLQGCIGAQYFLKDTLALTGEARYIHLSCAGLSHPNNGVNSVMLLIGLTWFF
jgi:lipid A 3-O-deacylase